MNKKKLILVLLFNTLIFSQISMSRIDGLNVSDRSITGSRYFTGEDGVLRIFVNVWGHVNNPGRIMVDEGIDIATLLSITGGPKKGANMKNIRLYREFPDENGKLVHTINLKNFINKGDREELITILPNDTFIIYQTTGSYLMEKIANINTLMSLVSLYFSIIQNN